MSYKKNKIWWNEKSTLSLQSKLINNMTIAQQLKVTEFPFIIKDKNGNQIYFEDSTGFWEKSEYDQNGKTIYAEDSNGFWVKRQFDQNGNKIYYETSTGKIVDKRPKVVELTLDEIAAKLNIDVNLLKIKK